MKIQHRIVILLLLITGIGLNAQGQWIEEKTGTTANLNSIQMINPSYGWVVGDQGCLLFRDKDRWELYPKITGEDLNAVYLIGVGDGWAVGAGGAILRLEGTKWRPYPSPTRASLYDISFYDSYHGIIVGANGTILQYQNGEWILSASQVTKGNFYTISVKDEWAMVAGGMEFGSVPVLAIQMGFIESYTEYFNPGYIAINDIEQRDDGTSFAVGTAGTIMCNDGVSWTRDGIFKKIPTLNSVAFSDENDGIAVGYFGTIMEYSASGWKKDKTPVKADLNGASVCETAYYAVGDNGTILSRIRKSKDLSEKDVASSLIQVEAYPNPSTDLLKIIIPQENDFVAADIAITNGYGQVILDKVLDPDLAGQVYRINTRGMKNGMYMIRITSADRKTALGKFIVKH